MYNLFVLYNCPDCSELKSMIKEEAIFDDEFVSEYGEKLNLIHFYNEEGMIETLNKLQIYNMKAPILSYNDFVTEGKDEILFLLKTNGFLKLPN